MKMIIEVLPHTGEERTSYHPFSSYPIKVGRGFKSDLILADPYVDANHVYIDYHEDNGEWMIADLGSVNGTWVNGKALGWGETPLHCGDTLKVGRTELRVFSPHHPVADAIPEKENHPIFNWIEKPSTPWIAFVLAIFTTQLWSYLEVWTDERGVLAAMTAASTVGIVTVWSLVWSVASRLIRNKSNFRKHVAIISLYLVAGVFVLYIQAYVDFLLNKNWFAHTLQYLISFTTLSVLIYGTLHFTSRMEYARAKWAAMLFSAGVLGGALLLAMISAQKFNPQPVYASGMEPYLSELVQTETIEQFMADNASLFRADTLKVKK